MDTAWPIFRPLNFLLAIGEELYLYRVSRNGRRSCWSLS